MKDSDFFSLFWLHNTILIHIFRDFQLVGPYRCKKKKKITFLNSNNPFLCELITDPHKPRQDHKSAILKLECLRIFVVGSQSLGGYCNSKEKNTHWITYLINSDRVAKKRHWGHWVRSVLTIWKPCETKKKDETSLITCEDQCGWNRTCPLRLFIGRKL